MGVLEQHHKVELSVLVARLDWHGAPVTVTRAPVASPLLVGLSGTLVHQTKHTVTLFNADSRRLHERVPKQGTVFTAVLGGGITVHLPGDHLVETW